MQAKFRLDSIEGNEAYYMRINRVKRMVEKGSDSKTVTEFDRYGNEITRKWYLDGKLYSYTETSYNEFGDPVIRITTYVDDDGKPETVFYTAFFYEVDSSGLSERSVKDQSKDTYYRDGESIQVNTTTTYTYDAKGQLISVTEIGKKGYCMDGPKSFKETATYTYDSAGRMLSQKTELEGGCDGKETGMENYTYDAAGREIKTVSIENGKIVDESYTEYDEMGRDKRWVSKDPDGQTTYEFIFEYTKTGLKKSCTSFYKGDKDYEEYNYDYY